jgi:tryptophanyl-tRNA synthetase
LRNKTIEIAKIYLASGLDPEKCTLFVQSHVSAHSELMWILNTLARMGDLDKMTQYKDKSEKTGETTSIGLYDYPVLQAADILLYDTDVVPVGEDQLQHVELTRTLARRFNERFGETFIIPEGKIQKEGARIMGLDDASKKMSKSASSEYNFISLMDDAETVRRKIKKAVTDSGTEITYSDDRPALKNLITIYSLLSEKTPGEIVSMYQGKGYGDFKADLAEVVVNFLTPFQERFARISDEEVKSILEQGAQKAKEQAEKKMKAVREKMGLL